MFSYKEVEKKDINDLFDSYVESLTGLYDDYLEYHILHSEFYLMTFNKKKIGYFAIFNDTMLTQFYVLNEYAHLAQGCFKTIHEQLRFEFGYVPTCDEFYLSIAMDFHKSIEMQAYFFTETNREVEPPRYPKSMLRLASLSDADVIKTLSGDFFDELYQMISDRKIYVLEDNEIYGFGIVEVNQIHKDCRGIGMYTVEEHRHKGIGRSIILHLRDLCHTLGFIPLPGCWYQNYNSKRTLESCGFVSKARLLKVFF